MFLLKRTSAHAHAVVARHEGVAVRTIPEGVLEDLMSPMRGVLRLPFLVFAPGVRVLALAAGRRIRLS